VTGTHDAFSAIGVPADPDAPVVAAALALGRALRVAGWRVVAAESCTGGLVARALTEIAGSSHWFECGFVTYSDMAKAVTLGVAEATLATHGAVSQATAREMALGALHRGRGDLALSVTGIAGPGGAVPGKPVGTVWFGWATASRIETMARRFDGDRAAVRRQAAEFVLLRALDLLPCDGARVA
jgi:nicotinamide-nucleotide amidase